MKGLHDTTLDFFRFYLAKPSDSHRRSGNDRSWEDLSAAVVRESAADPAKWFRVHERLVAHAVVPDACAAPIFDGIVTHLNIRLGRIPPPRKRLLPVSVPPMERVVRFLLDCIERQDVFLSNGQRIADAVLVLSETPQALDRSAVLIACLVRLSAHPDPVPTDPASAPAMARPANHDSYRNASDAARRSVRGKAAACAMRLAVCLLAEGRPFDPLLKTLLVRYATDPHAGVRIALLDRLTDLADHDAGVAWMLYGFVFRSFKQRSCQEDLWPPGESFLRMQYAAHRRRVIGALRERLPTVASDGRSWGNTMTEAFVNGDVSCKFWIEDLESLAHEDAWTAAFERLDGELENPRYRDRCKKGMLSLASRPSAIFCLLEKLPSFLLSRTTDFIDVKVEIAYRFILNFNGSKQPYNLFWLYRWIAELGKKAPDTAVRLRDDLMSADGRSEPPGSIWQAETYAGVLAGLPENDATHREQRG